MSRTDVHRPLRVQQADPYARRHFHRFQACPTQPPELWPLRNLCGCAKCTNKAWRKQERRRERARGKRECSST